MQDEKRKFQRKEFNTIVKLTTINNITKNAVTLDISPEGLKIHAKEHFNTKNIHIEFPYINKLPIVLKGQIKYIKKSNIKGFFFGIEIIEEHRQLLKNIYNMQTEEINLNIELDSNDINYLKNISIDNNIKTSILSIIKLFKLSHIKINKSILSEKDLLEFLKEKLRGSLNDK